MIELYFDKPFTTATFTDQIDTFVTNGGATYSTPNKTISRIGGTLQYSNVLKNLYNSGFTKTSGSITLNTSPVAGLQGVVPGIGAVLCNTYDNSTIQPNGNINTTSFYIGNVTQPNVFYYTAQAASAGIAISFVNNITSVGPDLTWVKLACSDAFGNILTLQATGTTLYTDNMKSFSTVFASASPFNNSIQVALTTPGYYFVPGDYLMFNVGTGTQEIIQLNSQVIGGSFITLTMAASFNFNHFIGEPVYFAARKFFLQQTTPVGYTANQATNYYNISILVRANENSRP